VGKRVVVFGATGYTGKLVVRSLLDLGVGDVVLGGRNRDKLEQLAAQHGGLEVRIADATRRETLGPLVSGAHVVISTAGPFDLYGEPVVRAALDAGAHFLDTTGEQAYMLRVLERYHGLARQKHVAVVNAQAFEYAIGYCAAALLADTIHALDRIDVFNRVEGFSATHGTMKSAVYGITAPALIRRGGRLKERGLSPLPMRVQVPGEKRELAIPFPGGEALHLVRSYPWIKHVTTNLVVPSALAVGAMALWSARPAIGLAQRAGAIEPVLRWIDAQPEGPAEAERRKQPFKVYARGRGNNHVRGVVASGVDPYGITGTIAALGAKLLLAGAPRATGVISTDQAFGARRFLDELAPFGVSVARY
jgi:short subunit dehydrogenase-like uncharacterized protein